MIRLLFSFFGAAFLLLTLQGCLREDLTGTIPVIKDELIGEYLENDPELFSEFTKMLNASGVMGLLKAYGLYTVFAPTDSAIYRYYRTIRDENGEYTITSMEQLSMKDIKEFCFNHIIKGDTIKTKTFREGSLERQSMSERFYSISFVNSEIFINGQSRITDGNIKTHNGIIHILDEALSPARVKLGECFEVDSANFTIYIDALKATGLYQRMNITPEEDETYNSLLGFPPDPNDQYNPEEKPKSRKIGFTILAVSDTDLRNCVYPNVPDEELLDGTILSVKDGIDNVRELELLARYYYSRKYNNDADTITNKTNRKHYLNRFMSYHCFDRVVLSSRFIKDLFTPNNLDKYPMRDYVETMLENTIIEVLLDKPGTVLSADMYADPRSAFGVFNYDDPVQGSMLTELRDLPNGGALNGFYHGITKPIMYTQRIEAELSSNRLRIDGASFYPELTTNNMRGSNPTGSGDKRPRAWLIEDDYIDGIECSPNTRITYVGACEYWENHQGDMFMVRGSYNLTFTTCPIPAGTYEVRFGFKSTTNRGIAQLYLDSLPCGIPLDLAVASSDPSIGYVKPGDDENDPYGFENDKMMHNRGYMKGGDSYRCSNDLYWKDRPTARLSDLTIRKVLGIFTFDETTKHQFTAISLGSSNDNPVEFMMDYLEFCPLEVLDKEGID